MSTSRRSVLVGSLALVACRLRAHGAGPVVQQRAPAFALPDAEGRVVTLDGLRARGPAVLVFYRGHW
ncbi:MAG: redoxin domain-containing protein [Deltaproteobacteria bacterium]|nr:redoxin domain-containing protein [Nannocystaceae bacterium]